MWGRKLSQAERDAIAADRAVERDRQFRKFKQGCLGCLGLLAIGVVFVIVVGRCGPEPLAPVMGDFRMQPLAMDQEPGTVEVTGWSVQGGADEQVVFTLEREAGAMRQCQFWSKALQNHLTELNPPREECRFEPPEQRPDRSLIVPFSMNPRSLKEGRTRRVEGRLLVPAKLADRFKRSE